MSQLEDLLQQCTVKLTVPGGWGTGFFVAPQWILTCAHVVKNAADQPIQLCWQGQENWATALVAQTRPDPYDLALLKVTLPPGANPPCVALGEAIDSRDPLYLFGYPDEGDPHGEPRTFNCDGLTGSETASILFNLGQVRPGMSGSPLLNQRTKQVCGIVKFTRDRSFDLGGGAIPTSVIFQQFPQLRDWQQQFHQGDVRWRNLVTRSAEIDFQPYLRSLIDTYQQWWQLYTLTEAVGQTQPQQAERPAPFDFGLMVQTVAKKEDDAQQPSEEKTERLPVLEGICKYADDHVLLIGRPGSGKSTALIRLLLGTASQTLEQGQGPIPILIELRYWQISVLERIQAFLGKHDTTLHLDETTLQQWLHQGRFLLLLDGLNELPSEAARRDVACFQKDFASTPAIFTSRELSLGGELGLEKKLEMQPLTETQMGQFVRNYLGEDRGEQLLQQLQNRLRELGQTPLLLAMLCSIFTNEQALPSNLGEVFRQFTQFYEQRLKGDVPDPDEHRDDWAKLLQVLAFAMLQGPDPVNRPTELSVAIPRPQVEQILAEFLQGREPYPTKAAERCLKDLLKHHLIQTNGDQIEFRHQLIQEYYAAEQLLQRLPTLTDEQLKRDYLNYLKWTEPIALMLALEQREAQALRVVKLALHEVDFMLGARLVGEVRLDWQATTVGWIDALNVPPILKCQFWATSCSAAAIPALLKALEHPDTDVRRSAANALGQIGSTDSIPGLLKALEHPDTDVRRSAVNALSQIGSIDSIPGLLDVLEDPDADVRRKTVDALGQLSSAEAIPGLLTALEHLDTDVRRSAANALGQIGSTDSIPGLLKALADPDAEVCRSAAEALGKIGSAAAIPGLLKLLEYPDAYVRRKTVDALGQLGSAEAIPGLLTALEDPDADVRRVVAKVLGKLGSVEAIPALLKVLQDPVPSVCWKALEALGELGSVEVIPKLLNAIEYPDSYGFGKVSALEEFEESQIFLMELFESPYGYGYGYGVCSRSEAIVETFVKLSRSNAEALVGLLKALETSDVDMRWRAAAKLGELGHTEAIPTLLKALQDPDSWVRREAIRALIKLGNTEALPALFNALEDSDPGVRREAIRALIKLGNTEALPALFNALEDSDSGVRHVAAAALGELGNTEALPALFNALEDSDSGVRQAAAAALGKLGNTNVLPALLSALEDPNDEVFAVAVGALGELGSAEAIPALLNSLEDRKSLLSWVVVADVFGEIGSSISLTTLWQLQRQQPLCPFQKAIEAIQGRCQFYNHELACGSSSLTRRGRAIARTTGLFDRFDSFLRLVASLWNSQK